MSQGNFLHLVRPTQPGPQVSPAPLSVQITSVAYHELLDTCLRSNENENNRVIGTLCGSRPTDGVVEIGHAFYVPHYEPEDKDEISIESDHQKLEFQLYKKAHQKNVVLGWFSTTTDAQNDISSTTGLIHDFYNKVSLENGSGALAPGIHITLNLAAGVPQLTAYTASTIGKARPGNSNYYFTPVPCEIVYSASDAQALSWIALAADQDVALPSGDVEVAHVNANAKQLEALVDSYLAYVSKVVSGEIQGDDKLGRALLKELSGSSGLDSAVLAQKFDAHVDDLLMVEHLCGVVKQQLDLSVKLSANFKA
ncbi:hypothetical protein BABINDRAFT_161112 [Babjeviella inositovora NRRL Y-12698]|uniref:MPN domain-containing protein n=1 Tax=Babjeviella inositovora NRRL Y-12698 TaxID=984486 RepID=A0A1E3QR07_9ASCO|nr:uncharacterized protein BABINDRAFT_161112 [Babjeviella inositovora NRRL Y-12698]ODQ80125.1 hypothetical protein BABINDRAFT_161112 [Babjeviella inositovora NRRL Y-12698]